MRSMECRVCGVPVPGVRKRCDSHKYVKIKFAERSLNPTKDEALSTLAGLLPPTSLAAQRGNFEGFARLDTRQIFALCDALEMLRDEARLAELKGKGKRK